jgi:hypothetical protein
VGPPSEKKKQVRRLVEERRRVEGVDGSQKTQNIRKGKYEKNGRGCCEFLSKQIAKRQAKQSPIMSQMKLASEDHHACLITKQQRGTA